jgi:hypothetical protein
LNYFLASENNVRTTSVYASGNDRQYFFPGIFSKAGIPKIVSKGNIDRYVIIVSAIYGQ